MCARIAEILFVICLERPIMSNTKNVPSLQQAILSVFGGGRIKGSGYPGRGGYYEVHFNGPVPKSLEELTKKLRKAMKLSNHVDQGLEFPIKSINGMDEWEFYVVRNDDYLVVTPDGTPAEPFLRIE